MDLDHIQICQRLKGAVDSVNNLDRQRRLSQLYQIARDRMGDIPFTGVGYRKEEGGGGEEGEEEEEDDDDDDDDEEKGEEK